MEMKKVTEAKTMMAALLGILLCLQATSASGLFYTGGVEINSIGIRVEIDDKATLKAVYLLTNYGDGAEEVNLQLAQCSESLWVDGEELHNPLIFKPGESKLINLTCELDVAGEVTKKLSIDSTLLFNGKPNSKPAKAMLIKVLLPEGVDELISASNEPSKEGFEGSRKFYAWSGINIYPTPVSLIWSTFKIDVDVLKKASPQKITASDQVIKVEIIIKNNGNTSVNNIILSDQYVVSDFEAVEPLEEFSRRESVLSWMKKIDSLKPGETRTMAYSVKYIRFSPRSYEFDLKPCVVTVDGHLVSMSNKVRMSQSSKEIPHLETPEVPMKLESAPIRYPSIPVIGGIILILIMGGIGFLKLKKRK